jgi:hypothetical protein
MTMVQDLGSYSEDATKVTSMGIKGKYSIACFSLRTSFAKSKLIPDGRKIKDLFHYKLFQSKIILIHLLIVDHK